MSTESLIPDFPPLTYADSKTKGTVRFGHAASRAMAANILALGRPARRIGPISGTQYAPDGNYVYTVSYSRSHQDIKQLWLRWLYRLPYDNAVSSAASTRIYVRLEIRDELGNTIPYFDSRIPIGFSDGYTRPTVTITSSDPACSLGGEGYLDLDLLASILTGSSWEFVFTTFTPGATVVSPFEIIEGWECPRSMVSDTAVYGALTGPLNPGNPILAGTTTTNNYARIAQTIEGGIKANHTLLSVAWPQNNSIAPALVSTTLAPFTRMLEGGTTPWSWRVRPRAVYNPNSAIGEPHRVRFLYRLDTSAGAPNGSIQITTGSTGSPYTTATLTSTSTVWSDWVSIDIPTDGFQGIATLQFRGKVNAATSTLYLYSIQVEENQ